jgi:hypothetical protein
VSSDPQVAAELVDQQCGVPASSKRDVKADSMTPASLARGCLDPTMSRLPSAPERFSGIGLASLAKLCLHRLDRRFRKQTDVGQNADREF